MVDRLDSTCRSTDQSEFFPVAIDSRVRASSLFSLVYKGRNKSVKFNASDKVMLLLAAVVLLVAAILARHRLWFFTSAAGMVLVFFTLVAVYVLVFRLDPKLTSTGKEAAQIIAFISVATLIIVQLPQGYLAAATVIEIETSRSSRRASVDSDLLKGKMVVERQRVMFDIFDIEARAICGEESAASYHRCAFLGIDSSAAKGVRNSRNNYVSADEELRLQWSEESEVSFSEPNGDAKYIVRMWPGSQTQFSCIAEVPRTKPCLLEVAFAARKSKNPFRFLTMDRSIEIVRATAVSLPRESGEEVLAEDGARDYVVRPEDGAPENGARHH